MNKHERAVIEAARACMTVRLHHPGQIHEPELTARLMDLGDALEALDNQPAAGLTEIPWAQVTEGDQVQGKSGTLYPVVATKREWKMGKPTGKFVITIDMAQGKREIIRPSESQPKAVVKRGDSGKAVDMFVHVFESGEI